MVEIRHREIFHIRYPQVQLLVLRNFACVRRLGHRRLLDIYGCIFRRPATFHIKRQQEPRRLHEATYHSETLSTIFNRVAGGIPGWNLRTGFVLRGSSFRGLPVRPQYPLVPLTKALERERMFEIVFYDRQGQYVYPPTQYPRSARTFADSSLSVLPSCPHFSIRSGQFCHMMPSISPFVRKIGDEASASL